MQEKGITLAENLAYNSEYGVLILDKESLHRLAAGIAKDEDVIFAAIQDVRGNMLAVKVRQQDAPAGKVVFEGDLNKDALGVNEPLCRLVKQKGVQPFYEVIVPVFTGEETQAVRETGKPAAKGDRIGVVRVGITLSNAQRTVAGRRNVVILMTLAILAIAVTTTIFLVARATSPILKLRDMTENIAAGELGQKIDISPGDEIGELASSFNTMTKRLKETTVSRNYVDSIVRNILETMIVVGPDKIIRTVNPAAVRLLGYEENELIGKPVAVILGEAESVFEGTGFRDLIDKGSLQDYEMTYITKTGEKVPVSFNGSVMRNKEGKLIGIVGIARDMRQIKRFIERERELASAEHKRAEELAQSQDAMLNVMEALETKSRDLAKAQKQLEAKTGELESFVYTASHDLKAPLVSMEGFSSALLNDHEDKLDENGRHYLERISANVSQMSKLIQDLLELSRIGRVVGSKETIDIKKTVEELRELFVSQLEKNRIKFHVKDELPKVKGDRNRIKQVFQNLISNAISYMGNEENPKIEIGCGSCDNAECRLYVRDNGIGIEKQYQAQIFNIFVRLKDIDMEGTGVGLSIVKKVVEHHGGKIWIESEKGKGTTFWFTLPAA
jgi:PAS domain S-box-containing protein